MTETQQPTVIRAYSTVTVQAAANGIAVAVLPQLAIGQRWIVSQIVVTSNSALASAAEISWNNQIIDATDTGNSDTADGFPAILVRSSDLLQVFWSGCSPGATCTATFMYEQI